MTHEGRLNESLSWFYCRARLYKHVVNQDLNSSLLSWFRPMWPISEPVLHLRLVPPQVIHSYLFITCTFYLSWHHGQWNQQNVFFWCAGSQSMKRWNDFQTCSACCCRVWTGYKSPCRFISTRLHSCILTLQQRESQCWDAFRESEARLQPVLQLHLHQF